MNVKLIKEAEAPLLSRRRLIFEVDYSGSKTPSKEDIKKTVAALQKVKEELVVVRHIYPRFGEGKAKIIAHFYNTLKDLKKYEGKKKEKKEEKPEKKPEEKPKEKAEEKVNAKEESKEQKAK